MKHYASLPMIVGLLFFSESILAQTKADHAREKTSKAIELMDNGRIQESLNLLYEARKLNPGDWIITYEIGYAHFLAKDYKKAISELNSLIKKKNTTDQVYQLLGSIHSISGNRDEAIKTFEKGLKIYPKSGPLHLELGNMQLMVGAYEEALKYYESGIRMAPFHPSNYYRAALILLNSDQEAWGMMYAEIFMNLESMTKRTGEMSKLLYDTYSSEIKFENDSTISVSFCTQSMVIGETGLPFCMVYEPVLLLSVMNERSINTESLHRIRTNFLERYSDLGFMKTNPNPLFDFWKILWDAGHFEAYNRWVLGAGEEGSLAAWRETNTEKWDAFVEWFNENDIPITADYFFVRD